MGFLAVLTSVLSNSVISIPMNATINVIIRLAPMLGINLVLANNPVMNTKIIEIKINLNIFPISFNTSIPCFIFYTNNFDLLKNDINYTSSLFASSNCFTRGVRLKPIS